MLCLNGFNNDRNHYRCTYAAEYADANRIAHPRSVYVREDHILEQLDPWLARAFSPSRLTETVQAMAAAQHDDVDQQAIKAARETLATCATRLDRYRAALDSGADPTIVSRCIADVQAEQVTAEADLRRLTGRRTMNPDEIHRVVEALGNITAVLRDADPAAKALIYRELGLTLTYRPTARTVSAQATPSGSCTRLCPRGDTNHYPTINGPGRDSASRVDGLRVDGPPQTYALWVAARRAARCCLMTSSATRKRTQACSQFAPTVRGSGPCGRCRTSKSGCRKLRRHEVTQRGEERLTPSVSTNGPHRVDQHEHKGPQAGSRRSAQLSHADGGLAPLGATRCTQSAPPPNAFGWPTGSLCWFISEGTTTTYMIVTGEELALA
jgi:hypothetical protein